MRDNPALRGGPLAVGGRAEQRGVIATCNYEARQYGIRSAMATAQALQRCPDLLVLSPAMEKYRAVSKQIFTIYREYTDLVEPLSLDEAYLDVTHARHCQGSATLIAQEIRTRIRQEIGITVSAGVAPNKFLAKIASDWNKPDNLWVIRPQEVDAFVAALPVERLFGVGRVTAAKLKKLGVHTCADLRTWSIVDLQHRFGKFGENLFRLSRGIDKRTVCATRERKSVSVEETYISDIPDLAGCQQQLPVLLQQLAVRVQRAKAEQHIHKLFVKIRFSSFRRTTAECVGTALDAAKFAQLLETAFLRSRQPVRLLGAGIRVREETPFPQHGLFDDREKELS